MKSIIDVQNMTVDYGHGKGVFNAGFALQKGEVVGFLGPNGAGKTTTIRQLMGFATPDRGRCRILGLDCKRDAARIQAHVGYLPGEIAFMGEMTGPQFICFVAAMKGLRGTGRAEELIRRFELDPQGRIRKMSKGMKQKIGIVCAFMQDADILILDEPTSGLDPLMQNRFIELVQEEKQRGKTILMSSHMFEEVERTCERAIIIRQGRIVADESIEALSAGKRTEVVVGFATPEMAAAFAAAQPGSQRQNGRRVQVTLQGEFGPFLARLGHYEVTALQPAAQNLESIFMHYYGGEGHA